VPSPAEPRFSVVVPTYRRPHLVGRAIASVLAQSHPDFELLVVDDGADAATRRAVEEGAAGDARVRYLARERRGGVSAARNTGIERASGRWVTFLDDDDHLLPGMLRAAADRIDASDPPLGFLWCAVAMVRDTPRGEVALPGRHWGPHFDRPPGARPLRRGERRRAEIDAVRIGAGFGLTVRRELLRTVGGFDPSLVIAEETDLVLRLLERGARFDAIREPQVVVHRVSGESLSDTTPPGARIASLERLCERNRSLLGRRPHLHAKMWESLGREYARAGDSARAWRMAGRMLRRHPATRNAWRMAAYAIASHRVEA
jgi:glycosyltransferase involved in cell wall biosynthesis